MNMTPRNIILLAAAIVVGVLVGMNFPLFGLVLLLPAIVYVIVVLVRNKGAAEADPAASAAAKAFTAPPGMAAIYVMRHGFVGGQQGMNISVGDGLTSQFRTGRFVRAEVAPGVHRITCQMSSQTRGSAVSTDVAVAAGECVLLDAKFDMGALQGRLVFLETRDPDEARRKLAPLKLVLWKDAAA